MDDIYENLENYEDVYDINELKNENKELKLKLEEYSKAMNQLQKDFDKLNNEYKKLELNYSSLLITARAEIERKGEIIKNLNVEKDKLIIKSMQRNGIHAFRNKTYLHESAKSTNNHDIDKNTSKHKNIEAKDNHGGSKRLEPILAPSAHGISSNENNSFSNEDKVKNVDTQKLNNIEMKENISQHCNKEVSQAQKLTSKRIMDRRKSTPATSSQEARFSSDEEGSRLHSKIIRRSPPKSMRYDYRDNRVESSNYKNSYYGDENCHRYGESLDLKRSHRYVSPERNLHRHSNEHSKHRLLKSPPSDKYSRSRSRDRRYNYARENHYDRHRYHENSSLSIKHKIRNDSDEPSSKRQKIDYRKCPSQDSNYISDKEKEYPERKYIPDVYRQFSCQSPDYVHSDNHFPHHSIKEIRSTATTTLEDPRISSKKYALQNRNNKTILCIPSNSETNFKCVNKTLWGVEKVMVPEALKNKPSFARESEDYLSQIYNNMEVDEPFERGELQSIEDAVILNTLEDGHDKNIKKNDKNRERDNKSMIDTAQQIIDSKLSQNSFNSDYKIPKKSHKNIKKPDNSQENDKTIKVVNKGDLKIRIECTRLSAKYKEHKESQDSSNCNRETTDHIKKDKDTDKCIKKLKEDKVLQDKLKTVEGDLELSDEESDSMEFQKPEDKQALVLNQPYDISSNKSESKYSPVEKLESEVPINKVDNKKTEAANSKVLSTTKENSSKESSRDSSRKRKSKKKSESKDISSHKSHKDTKDKSKKKDESVKSKHKSDNIKDKVENIKDKVEDIKNNIKDVEERHRIKDDDKRNSGTSEPVVNKFNELFGDTSSLITPDDLGITVTETQVKNDNIVAFFESTEIATDVNIEEVTKAHDSNTNCTFDVAAVEAPNEEIDYKTNAADVISSNTFEKDKKDNIQLSTEYENTKAEALLETSNVVKTVIISTGVQPQTALDTKLLTNPDSADNRGTDIVVKKIPHCNLKALATSTPHKIVFDDKNNSHTDSANTNATSIDFSSSNIDKSNVTTNESQTDDVPDVRIFVRRRKKVVRKATT